MRQAVMTAPGKIEFRTVPDPHPGPGEVLLRIQRIGICGSDMHVNHGRHPFTKYPVVQGHEYSGVIEALGPGVAGLQLGTLATAMPQIYCGQCPPCRRGDYNICENLKVQGFQAPGCAQDLFVVKSEQLVPLPANFTPEQGALVEPLAVAVHAVNRAGKLAGKNVVVTGAGTIGNLTAQVARAAGGQVLITDLSAHRLDLARQCRIPHVSDSRSEKLIAAVRQVFGPERFQAALECSAAEAAINALLESIAKGGVIVQVGLYGEKPRVNLSQLQEWELTLIGSLMYRRADYVQAVNLIATSQVLTPPLESRHFPLAAYADAYHYLDQQGNQCLKVFIDL